MYFKPKTMIEFTQKILHAVSFDKDLFQKELKKGLKWITDAEESQILSLNSCTSNQRL